MTMDNIGKQIKVLQFGDGVFLRAFADYFFDRIKAETGLNLAVTLVTNIDRDNLEPKRAAEYKYTVRLEGFMDGAPYSENRVVNVIQDGIDYFKEPQRFFAMASDPDLTFTVSNTTEAGIRFAEGDKIDALDISYPARVTKLLYLRYLAFNGAKDKGLHIIACELIDDNGATLKKYVLDYCKLWNLPGEFVNWVNESNFFCSSLVDRIVSGFPTGREAEYFEKIGKEDKFLDVAEPFGLWAIENKGRIKELLGGGKIKEIIFAEDIKPYKIRKVRLLNALHTSLVPFAYLKGYDTVCEAINDKDLFEYVDYIARKEIMPTINLPQEELNFFYEGVIERFRNPYINHKLIAISKNSVSKWRARVMPIVEDYAKLNGHYPEKLFSGLKALYDMYSNGKMVGADLVCTNAGRTYTISDEPYVMEYFAKAPTYEDFAANTEFWGKKL